ncbi:MAG: alpha/beta fold hydrolase [Candidatus Helarchaeota archaeon]
MKRRAKLLILMLSVMGFSFAVGLAFQYIGPFFINTPSATGSPRLESRGVPYWDGSSGIWNLTYIRNETDLNPVFIGSRIHPFNTRISGVNRTYNLNITVWNYSAMIYQGDILNISSALIFPDNSSGQLNKTTGMILFHGIFGSYNSSLDLAYELAARNITVLCISFPGHGESDGPPPTPENIFPLTDFYGMSPSELNYSHPVLKKVHFYLSTVAGIRGLDFLLSRKEVNTSRIIVSGGSYGGIHTYFVSTVAHENVSLAIPLVAVGDLRQSYNDNSFTHIIVPKMNFNDPHILSFMPYFDPFYYTQNVSETPPTCVIIGANDEYFTLHAINNHFQNMKSPLKAISLSPAGHHGPLMHDYMGTYMYFIEHVLDGGPAPPQIQVRAASFISSLSISVEVTCAYPIDAVKIGYRYALPGHPWIEVNLQKVGNSYVFNIPSYLISSSIDYFIMVELTGSENDYVLFSTQGYQAFLFSGFTPFFFIFLFFGLAIPGIILACRRHEKIKIAGAGEKVEKKVLRLEMAKLGTGLGTQVGIIAAYLYLPLIIINPFYQDYEINLNYLLNQFPGLLMLNGSNFIGLESGDYTTFIILLLMGLIILIGFLVGYLLVMISPFAGGILNIVINLLLLIPGLILQFSISYVLPIFGITHDITYLLGLGVYVPTILSTIQLSLGLYNRRYWKKLKKQASESKTKPEPLGKYSIFTVLFTNGILIISLVIGFIGLYPLNIFGFPHVSIIFVGLVMFMHLYLLRKVLCTKCVYHGKRCHTGWGLIAGKFFMKGNIEDFTKKSTWVLPIGFWLGYISGPILLMSLILLLGTVSETFLVILIAEGFIFGLYLIFSVSTLFLSIPLMGCRFCKEHDRCLATKVFPFK